MFIIIIIIVGIFLFCGAIECVFGDFKNLKEKPKSHFQRVQITIRNTKRNKKDLNAKQHSSLLCKRKEADLITLYDVAEISNNLFLFSVLMMESKEEKLLYKVD